MASTKKKPAALNSSNLSEIIKAVHKLRTGIIQMPGMDATKGMNRGKPCAQSQAVRGFGDELRRLLSPSERPKRPSDQANPDIDAAALPASMQNALRIIWEMTALVDWHEDASDKSNLWCEFLDEIADELSPWQTVRLPKIIDAVGKLKLAINGPAENPLLLRENIRIAGEKFQKLLGPPAFPSGSVNSPKFENADLPHAKRTTLRNLWGAVTSFAWYFDASQNVIKWCDFLDEIVDELGAKQHPPRRVVFHDEALTITIDRRDYTIDDPAAFGIVKYLHDRMGQVCQGKEIRQHVKGINGKNAILQKLKRLPSPVRDCVVGQSGSGYHFRLPTKPTRKVASRD